MATEKLYYADPYLKEMDATVLSCEERKNGYAVLLDRTVFYPTGGGQPYDTGDLGGAKILDVSYEGEAEPVTIDFAGYGIKLYCDESDLYLPVSLHEALRKSQTDSLV